MLTKSHCGGNLIYLGPFCAVWVSEQAFKGVSPGEYQQPSSQFIIPPLSAQQVHSENEGIGDSGLLPGAEPVGFLGFLLVMVLVAQEHMPNPFLRGRMCLECRGPSLELSPAWDGGQRC